MSSQTRVPPPPPRPGGDRFAAGAAYTLLFLFGLLQGLIGTFQYSRGPAPVLALVFDLAILLTCVLGAWGMRSPGGGLLPGGGWLLCTFIMASYTGGGSILITNTTAGKCFLFGGAAAAAVGCLVAFLGWSRASQPRTRRP